MNALATSQAPRSYSTDFGHPSPPISQYSERTTATSAPKNEQILDQLCDGLDRSIQTPTVSVPTGSSCSAPYSGTISRVTSPATASFESSTFGATMAEADMLLSRYCRLMAPTFPFVLVPAHATAQSLASDHPVMLQAIITVAFYHDYPQQQNLVKQFMKSVGERMFISNEKSLDLLQGILIVTAWYHPHIFNSQQATNMLYMAQALATDLQIGKHPFQCDHFRQAALKHGVASINPARNPNTLNDHRALAGLIYLTSLLGCAFKKVDSMKFTKYLDEALVALEQAHEHDSDLMLVQLVRSPASDRRSNED